jgi:nicotinamidase-related amidase
MNIHLVVIDPQKDFCDPHGALFAPGADEDVARLAGLVDRLRDRIRDIHVTLDSHRKVDISHPMWWRDASGRTPDPFTAVTVADVESGRLTTARPDMRARSLRYLRALQAGGRYPHTIWPYHCLIGDEGHAMSDVLAGALHEWEERFAMVDFITKGSNPWTEHFSGVQAEVPDPDDASTQINTRFIRTLEDADVILMAGEALSHCVANTVRDIADQLAAPQYIAKIHLLRDATSNVPGFDAVGEQFVRDMTARGMHVTTTTDFRAA